MCWRALFACWPVLCSGYGFLCLVNSSLPLMRTNRLIWLQVDKKVTDLSPSNPKPQSFYYLCGLNGFSFLFRAIHLGNKLAHSVRLDRSCTSCIYWKHQIPMSSVKLQRMSLPAIDNDMGTRKRSLISNQFEWLEAWDLFRSCAAERDLCCELHMCRNGSCLAVMGLMDAEPWQTWQISELKSLEVIIPCYIFDWIHIYRM